MLSNLKALGSLEVIFCIIPVERTKRSQITDGSIHILPNGNPSLKIRKKLTN